MTQTMGYCGLPFKYDDAEEDIDGRVDKKFGIRYIGKARLQQNGKWRCLADINGALCLVEISLRFDQSDDSRTKE